MKLANDLREFVGLLNSNGVDYIVVGGHAVSYQQAWSPRDSGELGGLPVSFLDRDSLLANKRASGRAQAIADIEALERVHGNGD